MRCGGVSLSTLPPLEGPFVFDRSFGSCLANLSFHLGALSLA